MRGAHVVAVVIVGVSCLAVWGWSQSTVNERVAGSGRYQLVAATVPEYGVGVMSAAQHLFMVDSATGRIWEYVPSGPMKTATGKAGFTPEMFVRVFVDELEGTVPEQMQKTSDYFEKHPVTTSPK